MKIKYQQNPLNTIIELDDNDIEKLRLKLIIEDLKERIYDVQYILEKENPDVEKALKEIDEKYFEDETLQNIANRKIEWMKDELTKSHVGDCMCFPMSCAKCYAESLLGIDTIKGLGKHHASKIYNEFKKYWNINDVINSLENYIPPKREGYQLKLSSEEFNKLVLRWTKESKEAAEWLEVYKNEKF